ncbi:hypothetical protein [Streptomyces sp. H27-C3]|uniref:hypothetical protein n=1 Tax=Streptomyces sp. H27-C3 TaxID=3046305 RepID=UPI0024B88A11|nr:hypothetical protein [Streptomyces sp. H27-C3]MDJ0460105.1 hypothetical protein [Streptomyces sp. H27-C3]
MTGKPLMPTFSSQFLTLARPGLAWACEQLDLFDALVPAGVVSFDLDEPSVTRSGIALRGHVLGTYAARPLRVPVHSSGRQNSSGTRRPAFPAERATQLMMISLGRVQSGRDIGGCS